MSFLEKVSTRRLHQAVIGVILLIPFCWFFGSVLFSSQTFAFRDAAHFYHPLFEWTTNEWRAGRVPLWNPQENCGAPVLADTTASVFYPGTLVFFSPLPYVTNYNLYVSLHILLAFATTFSLARSWRASTLASALAAVSYVFGGKVLFEHSNVIFLVSAAWLPLALLALDRMLTTRRWHWALMLGIILALMILGGDPQTAYHVLLLSGGYAFLLWRAERRAFRATNADGPVRQFSECFTWNSLKESRLVLLVVSVSCAGLLAAVQILPAREWTKVSDRAAYDKPRNVYEAAEDLVKQANSQKTDGNENAAAGIVGQPEPGHHRLLYRFSVGPWRLPELFWPNLFGRWLPGNHRWLGVLLVETFVWTPSLYMGILPLLLAIRGWSFRDKETHWACMAWMVLLGIVGAFGEWGLGSLLELTQYAITRQNVSDHWLGRPVGGLYWLMVTILPTYVYFRFPAKLWTLAALGIALLAARGWDRLFERTPRLQLQSWFGFLGRQSAVGLCVALIVIPFWAKWMQYVPKESLMGAIDATAAWWDVVFAFSHTMIICAALWWIVGQYSQNQKRVWPCLALVLTMLDITIANRWLVQTADESMVRQTPKAVESMLADGMPLVGQRVYRGTDWSPHDWWQNTSSTRLNDTFRWRHDTLYPKFHLRNDVALVESQGTLTSVDLFAFMEASRAHGVPRPDGASDPPPAILRALSTQYLVLPDNIEYTDAVRIDNVTDNNRADSTAIWRLNDPAPRAWVVRDVTCLPPLQTRKLGLLRARTEEALFPEGKPRDLLRSAVVETNEPITLYHATLDTKPTRDSQPTQSSDSCKLSLESPQHVEIDIEMRAAGLVVLNDLYYAGWIATVTTAGEKMPRQVPIHRVNRIMRGVVLPAGTHRLVYEYQPNSFRQGAIVSSLSWLIVIIVAIFGGIGRLTTLHWPSVMKRRHTRKVKRAEKAHELQI